MDANFFFEVLIGGLLAGVMYSLVAIGSISPPGAGLPYVTGAPAVTSAAGVDAVLPASRTSAGTAARMRSGDQYAAAAAASAAGTACWSMPGGMDGGAAFAAAGTASRPHATRAAPVRAARSELSFMDETSFLGRRPVPPIRFRCRGERNAGKPDR